MTFTEGEQNLLVGVPQLIGAAIASASGSGIIGTGKEFITGATSLLDGLKTYPNNSVIMQVLPDPSADRGKAFEWARASREWITRQVSADGRPTKERLAEVAVQACEAATKLLDEKASPTEAQEYRAWVLSVAERVASASSEGGFLGFGGEWVTPEEKVLIERLKTALRRTATKAIGGIRERDLASSPQSNTSQVKRALAGRKVTITAGQTQEYLAVGSCFVAQSKGTVGYALAEAAVALGAETILVSGPVNMPIPPGAQLMMADTTSDMLKILERELPCDIAVHAAAVPVWRLDENSVERLSKAVGQDKAEVTLVKTPDILRALAMRTERRPAVVAGFFADGNKHVSSWATALLDETGCDLIVAEYEGALGELAPPDRHSVQLVARNSSINWSSLSTPELAGRLMKELAAKLESAAS